MTAPTGIGRFSLAPYNQSGGTMWTPPGPARPTIEGSAVLLYPEAAGIGSDGTPSHYIGKPHVIIRRSRPILESVDEAIGYQWYWQAEGWTYYPIVWAEFFDPRYLYTSGGHDYKGDWRVFKAVMHRPKITEIGIPTDTVTVAIMEVLFTEIEVIP